MGHQLSRCLHNLPKAGIFWLCCYLWLTLEPIDRPYWESWSTYSELQVDRISSYSSKEWGQHQMLDRNLSDSSSISFFKDVLLPRRRCQASAVLVASPLRAKPFDFAVLRCPVASCSSYAVYCKWSSGSHQPCMHIFCNHSQASMITSSKRINSLNYLNHLSLTHEVRQLFEIDQRDIEGIFGANFLHQQSSYIFG